MLRIYMRCSSDSQDTDSQRDGIDRWLAVFGDGQPVSWYVDEGIQGDAAIRPAYNKLMKDIRRGDTVVCWALDRLSREGIIPVLTTLKTFDKLGCRLISISEPWADSSNPVAEVVIAVMAWAAQMEKKRIRARQAAGIAAARQANGGKCPWGGRAKGSYVKRTAELDQLVRQLKQEGKSVCAIARLTQLSRPTVYAILGES